jgi:hypothetical protein
MTDPENGAFQIHLSKAVTDELRNVLRRAIARGEGKAVTFALRRIVRALREDPYSTGEPLYELPNMRLQIRSVTVAPLAIHFAVSRENPHVYLKRAVLLSAREPDK